MLCRLFTPPPRLTRRKVTGGAFSERHGMALSYRAARWRARIIAGKYNNACARSDRRRSWALSRSGMAQIERRLVHLLCVYR